MMRVVVVPRENAERVREELRAIGIVDRGFRITKRGRDVLIPVTADPPFDLGPRLAHMEATDTLDPRPAARDIQAELQSRLVRYRVPLELAPAKWERLGDIVVVRLSEEAREYGYRIGCAFAETLDAQTVVEDVSGIHGVMRTPKMQILWGRGLEAVHNEGGVRYVFDVAKIMFSSGNLPERVSVASKVRPGDVVVDLFAGIGYFTLPIAMHARPERVYACELNPVAYHYLQEGVRVNRVANVMPLFGDCRKTAPRGVADVVIMGHFSAADYLDVAFESLRGAGLVIYHELCPREQFPTTPMEHLTAGARRQWYDLESVESRIRKSYAPGIVHAVLEARVRRRPRAPMSG